MNKVLKNLLLIIAFVFVVVGTLVLGYGFSVEMKAIGAFLIGLSCVLIVIDNIRKKDNKYALISYFVGAVMLCVVGFIRFNGAIILFGIGFIFVAIYIWLRKLKMPTKRRS